MVLDKIGTSLLPTGWEMWTTGNKWQAQTNKASENKPETYTGLYKTRGDAIREAKNIIHDR